MVKPVVLGVLGVPAAALAALAFSGGVAAADDYAGQSYSDASAAISSAGQKVVIASTVGDQDAQGDCVVSHSQKAPWIKGDSFAPVTDTVLVYLNCDAKLASNKTPGNSLASPEGQAEKATEDEAAAKAAAQQNEADQLAGTDQSVGAPGAH
ncbi:hypothetical protein [Mycolicibacterium komossense]|uniref:hypothetical protein n=1 Tax=Mycolicibacterium komossense TaxID=1779 RepID=UPI003F49262E